MAQRSPEWRAIRCGKLTASDAESIFAKGRGGEEATTRRDLRWKLVAEILSGQPQNDDYVNAAMAHGIEQEDAARRRYEAQTGEMVEAVGFLAHDDLAAGCSPDGLVGVGLLELKAPKTATHISYMRDPDALVAKYWAQLTHALWVSEAPWVDIASFDPRLPSPLQFVTVRVARDAVDLKAHDAAVRKFLAEVELEVASLKGWSILKETA